MPESKIKMVNQGVRYFLYTFFIAAAVYFLNYEKVALMAPGQWDIKKIEYEELFRQGRSDQFIMKKLNQENSLYVVYRFFSYENIPAHIMYRFFHLRGANLWLAQKVLLTTLGIGLVLLMFIIGNSLYGPKTGMLAGVLTAFAPHLWICYNLNGWARSYNLFLSLLTASLFLWYMQKNRWYLLVLTGISMALNFLIFHIGSFAMPIIIFLYGITSSIMKRNLKPLKMVLGIIIVSVISFLVMDLMHSAYFNLDNSVLLIWLKEYLKSPAGSHSGAGLVILHPAKIVDNFMTFIRALFVNGNSFDWHYDIAPPNIPLVYSCLIGLFFIPGCYIVFKERRESDIFFFIWFSFFLFVYSFLIVIRLKNVIWMIFPIIILSLRGLKFIYSRLALKGKYFFKMPLQLLIVLFVIFYSASAGAYFIFYELPQKNFYNFVSQSGRYQVFNFISKRGYTERTKIISTFAPPTPLSTMRFYTEDTPTFISLKAEGISSYPEVQSSKTEAKILELESKLMRNSDRIYYVFHYFDNHYGYIYTTDENYQKSFVKIHPEAVPYEIRGTDGKVIWAIYEISSVKDDSQQIAIKDLSIESTSGGMQNKLLYAVGPNLVKNGGFSRNTDAWQLTSENSNKNISMKSIPGGQRGNCLAISDDGDAGKWQIVDQNIKGLTNGKSYEFSLFMKSGTASATPASMLIGYASVMKDWEPLGETTDKWTKHSFVFEAKSTEINIKFAKNLASDGTILFDTVGCYELTSNRLNYYFKQIINFCIRPLSVLISPH